MICTPYFLIDRPSLFDRHIVNRAVMADDWFGGFCKGLFVHTYICMYGSTLEPAGQGALGNFSAFITDYSIKYSYINKMMHKISLKAHGFVVNR